DHPLLVRPLDHGGPPQVLAPSVRGPYGHVPAGTRRHRSRPTPVSVEAGPRSGILYGPLGTDPTPGTAVRGAVRVVSRQGPGGLSPPRCRRHRGHGEPADAARR